MKKFWNYCLLIGVFMLVLTGGATQFLDSGATMEAFAMGHRHPIGHNNGNNGGNNGGSHQVTEPLTLSLLGLGAAGVGILYAIKRRK